MGCASLIVFFAHLTGLGKLKTYICKLVTLLVVPQNVNNFYAINYPKKRSSRLNGIYDVSIYLVYTRT